jgi:hypothetical protein
MQGTARSLALGALCVTALALSACGGGDDDSGGSSPPATVAQVSACFADLGQHPRKVEVSLAKLPPDLGVSDRSGTANVWVTDDPQAVIDQEQEFSQLDSAQAAVPVEDKVVQGGNVIAVLDANSSPAYRNTIARCIPPSG